MTKRTRHLGNRERRKNRKNNAAERVRDKAKERKGERETERDGCLVVSEECLLSALSVVSLEESKQTPALRNNWDDDQKGRKLYIYNVFAPDIVPESGLRLEQIVSRYFP